MPVIEHFNKQGKVAEVGAAYYCYCNNLTYAASKIDSSASIDEVYAKTRVVVERLFAGEVTRNVTV